MCPPFLSFSLSLLVPPSQNPLYYKKNQHQTHHTDADLKPRHRDARRHTALAATHDTRQTWVPAYQLPPPFPLLLLLLISPPPHPRSRLPTSPAQTPPLKPPQKTARLDSSARRLPLHPRFPNLGWLGCRPRLRDHRRDPYPRRPERWPMGRPRRRPLGRPLGGPLGRPLQGRGGRAGHAGDGVAWGPGAGGEGEVGRCLG